MTSPSSNPRKKSNRGPFAWFDNKSVSTKMITGIVTMIVPIVILAGLLLQTKVASIQFTRSELEGLRYLEPLTDVTLAVARHRGVAALNAASGGSRAKEIESTAREVDAAVDRVTAIHAEIGAQFGLTNEWDVLKSEWQKVRALEGTASESVEAHTTLVTNLLGLASRVAAASNLILDPEAAPYSLIDAAIIKMPRALERFSEAQAVIATPIESGQDSEKQEKYVDIHELVAIGSSRTEDVLLGFDEAMRASDAIGATMKPLLAELRAAALNCDDVVHEVVPKGGTDVAFAADRVLEAVDRVQKAAINVERTAASLLREMLQARVDADRRSLIISMASSLVIILFAAFMAWRMGAVVGRRAKYALAVLERIGSGALDNEIVVRSSDEMGRILDGLNHMQTDLRTRIEREREVARVNERIKQALDSSGASVMITDQDLNIIYVNRSATSLMASAESQFRRELPAFEASKVLGSSIDVFHKNPAHMHRLLKELSKTYVTDLRIGGRPMRLIVNPVTDPEGQRIGTMIEWIDRTMETAAQEEVASLVTAVSDGALDTRVTVEGKTGFYKVLATGLNALVDNVAAVVADVQSMVHAANEGDLTRRMTVEGKRGLYVRLGNGINALVENMSGVVHKVKSAANEVYRGAEEISAGNQNLSQRTEEQASSLEETASSMEQITATVKQYAENAGQANQLAQAARAQADKGGQVVSQAVKAMSEINASSKRIADIIGVIDEIAFQTNLLALNAAVEAARAGEQGRGFAVVAGEVRNLASRSATAAKEIKELIQDSVKRVEDGSSLVMQSGTTLEQIVLAVKKVTDIVGEISSAGREQSAGIEQVNKAVMVLDDLTQQNAALVEEAAAASQSMADQARMLNEAMARYRVADGNAAEAVETSTTFARAANG